MGKAKVSNQNCRIQNMSPIVLVLGVLILLGSPFTKSIVAWRSEHCRALYSWESIDVTFYELIDAPRDPWGNVWCSKSRCFLGDVWSAGPNGINELKEGDDVVVYVGYGGRPFWQTVFLHSNLIAGVVGGIIFISALLLGSSFASETPIGRTERPSQVPH